MLQLKILLFLSICNIAVYGQSTDIPDECSYRYPEYKRYNRDLKVYHIKEPAFCEAAAEIEALPLRCDTIKQNSHYLNKYLYFDNEGRLRKYWTHNAGNDGAAEFLELRVYYDTMGALVYMDYSSGNNCADEGGYFVLHNGKIVERDGYHDCGCCEDDDTTFIMKLPDKGAPFPRNMSIWWDFSSFSDAATLLNVLEVYKYDGEFNIEFTGKEEVFAKILDKCKLKHDTLNLDKNGWNRITTSYDNAGHIQKCHINNSSEKDGEFIRLYYDTSGELFLIDYQNIETISNKSICHESFILYIEQEIITGGKYYQNSGLDKNKESCHDEWDRILNSLTGTRLNKTPYLKKDLSPFLNTKKLKEMLKATIPFANRTNR